MSVKPAYGGVILGVTLIVSCDGDHLEPIGTVPDLNLEGSAAEEPAQPPFDQGFTKCLVESVRFIATYRFGVMDRALYEDPELRRVAGFARTDNNCERGYRLIRAQRFLSGLRSGRYQECKDINDFEDCSDFAEENSEFYCEDDPVPNYLPFWVTNELETVRVQCIGDGELFGDVTTSTPAVFECSVGTDTIIVSSPGFESVTLNLGEPMSDICGKPLGPGPFTFPE